ncbi:uncharacterized protein J7T54_005764 [Emericellopsis cladophorae]|uniref:Pre-mRNA-splicing factor n=1 Tax=Emericellopsis cladophorae TaxID=2686198 RepID=A0A9Q0BD25_9HYPO|nr:uncharacterized protein J7T54_005764 [Emericellopsis cladophorae]KAI6779734.1 hypothetical protein J7T54_005764 [Emericellopsis cladophorae]
MSGPPKPRIAISLGSSRPASSSKPRAHPPSTLGKRPHPSSFGHDSDSEDDAPPQQEAITGFGVNGAESRHEKNKQEKKEEYVIPRLENTWKGGKRQRSGLPGQDNGHDVKVKAEREEEPPIKWGLTVKEKKDPELQNEQDEETKEEQDAPPIKKEEEAPLTDDQRALNALTGVKEEHDDLVIPTETDAYRKALDTVGDNMTQEDYDALPEDFDAGRAMLLGMGWDGKERGGGKKEVKRRPKLMGLGAKKLDGKEDLEAWDQKAGSRDNRPPRLKDHRREEELRKEARRGRDSYKSERDREKESNGGRYREARKDRERDSDRRHRDRHHDDRRHRSRY